MQGSYLGPEYSQKDIEETLKKIGANFSIIDEDQLIDIAAEDISKGEAIGWFQGRMEFGPRALGGRSILGDPRSGEMQKNLNLKVKYRESFRPFAPSILKDEVNKWFDLTTDSPYMLLVSKVKSIVLVFHVPMEIFLIELSSAFERIGLVILSLLTLFSSFSKRLPSGPMRHSRDIITSSLMESIAGFVTCAKSCLK